MDRRRFMKLGLGGGLSTLALGSLGEAAWAASPGLGGARACILVFLHGGPSQFETFDPKPGQSTGGPTRGLATSVSGLRVSAQLPELARRMKHFGLVRSLSSREGNHDRARYMMHTGFVRQGGVVHPGFGSVVSKRREPGALPHAVSIGAPGQAAGYLGAAHAPFPVLDPRKPVRNLEPHERVSDERARRRVEAWRSRHAAFEREFGGVVVQGQGQLHERALAMMGGPAREAFDLARVDDSRRARYGQGSFGQGCLMAHRLVEAGVSFVEVSLRGWDTHQDNFARTDALCAQLDQGLSALTDDLIADGLWSQTLVLCVGDFGRTPRINERGGRDHFPAISTALLGGAGIRAGAVVGSTDATGEAIVDRPVSVADFYATVANRLGIAGGEVEISRGGRPVQVVDPSGALIDELV